MVHLIAQISKYLIIILFAIYTYESFACLRRGMPKEKVKKHNRRQVFCMFLIQLDAYGVIFAVTKELKIWIFWGAQVLFFLFVFFIYRVIYKRASALVVNHMCMLMSIGFIVLCRLDFEESIKQFEVAAIAFVATILIPLFIHKIKVLKKFTWFYAVLGILALGVVLVLGSTSYGAKLSFTIAGFSLQPSEFIKIVFVFFVACMLYENTSRKQVLLTLIVAVIHVGILVLSKDLGAALIYFVAYLVMLYVATRKPLYFFGGLGVGAVAAIAASKMFTHVQQRVTAWKDPFSVIENEGWQIAHSLFAIGTGSWFGMGLYQGMPQTIPVVDEDAIFAAIAEEFGGLFAICLILVCCSCFLMFLNIAMQIRDQFYKLIALGLGTVYGIQVFLNIGGVIKCIPLTGVTLPLISHGGSSILSTLIIFAIIQGLYIMREKEGEEDEKRRRYEEQETRQEGRTGRRAGNTSERGRSGRVSEGTSSGGRKRAKNKEKEIKVIR